jgi:NitT/TauT family transport system ATP-binding protein
MITVSSASLSYQKDGKTVQVLRDISFDVELGTSCAIIGPSGCGKTSLLFLLAGIRQPDSGTISMPQNARCGTILQNYGLFPWKTVTENIELGLVLGRKDKKYIRDRTADLVNEMKLGGFESYFPGQLSGGMQQRVALARALAIDPDILLMDEPLSSLDALTRERLQNLILTIRQTKKITTLLVTHSIEEAVFLGQKIIVLGRRPAGILQIVENTHAEDPGFRHRTIFFDQCNRLRDILKEEIHGE